MIPFEEYLKRYSNTTFVLENNLSTYKRNLKTFDFTSTDRAAFKFTLDKNIDCTSENFAFNVCQQGDRMAQYRLNQYEPSSFNISVLRKSDNSFVVSRTPSQGTIDFSSCVIMENITLEKGEYVVIIEPNFNKTADRSPDYKKANIDLVSTQTIELLPIDGGEIDGMFMEAAKKYCKQLDNVQDQ